MNLAKSALCTLAVACLGITGIVPSGHAQHWTATSAPNTNWACVAASADGLKVLAGVGDGPLYLSTNGGLNWSQSTAPSNGWSSVISSADGNTLVGNGGGGIYVSHDSGATWFATGQGANAIACSSDGTKIFATAWFGVIRRSLDGGTNWSDTHSPNPGWTSIASSADGTEVLAVCSNNGNVFRSTNSGLDWDTVNLQNSNWQKALSSADGNRLMVATTDPTWGIGQIYVSTNAGAGWDLISASDPASGTYLGGIATSAEGNVLVIAKTGAYGYPGGSIFVSWDSGDFWTLTDAPFVDWSGVACSADGTHLFAATASGLYALDIGSGATLAARGTNGNAVFQAVLNPNGNETTAWFEWGTTTNHGNVTEPRLIGSGGIAMFHDFVTNLDIGTDYYYRVVATNSAGLLVGEDRIYRSPVIELVAGNNLAIDFDQSFDEPGAFVANQTLTINVSGSVDSSVPGVYTLTYSATNSLGIMGTTNRTVTVRGPKSILAETVTNLTALRATLPNDHMKALDSAIGKLTQATADGSWTDEANLAYPQGQEVFTASARMLDVLTSLARQGTIPLSDLEQYGFRVTHSERLLAVNAINATAAAGATQSQVRPAIKELLVGDQAVEREKFAAAVQHYQSAWKQATRLLAKLNK